MRREFSSGGSAEGCGDCCEAEHDSITGGLPEGSAVVVAAQEFVGFGVDGDEFAVAPDAGAVFVGYGEAVDGVAHGRERFGGWDGEFFFEVEIGRASCRESVWVRVGGGVV